MTNQPTEELEIYEFTSQDDLDYDEGFTRGQALAAKAKEQLKAECEGSKSDAFDDGLYDGFYD